MSREQTDLGPESDEEFDDFSTDEVTGLSSYTFSDRIKQRMRDLGLTGYADRPRLADAHSGIFPDLDAGDYFNGRLPVVVRRLSLDQVSALYTLYTAWFAYLTFQTNMIAAERSEAFTQKEFVWSHVRKQYKYYTDVDDKIKKRTDQQMSDEARCDYRFVKANSRYTELNTLYKSMLDTMEVAKKDMEMVSREVTIVQTKLEAEAQAAGMKGRPWRGQGTNEAENQTRRPRPSITKPRR
jgi:hypothetical protein